MSGNPLARIPSRFYLYGALILAFLLRVEYLRELIPSPFGRHLLLDAQGYDQAARLLRQGVPLAPDTAYFRPPAYPMFVSAIYALTDGSVWAVRGVQWILGLANVVFCWAIAKRTHDDRVAALTAFLAGTYGMFIYFEGELLTTSVAVVATTAAAWTLLEADRRSWLPGFAAGGLLIGVGALLHGTVLALAPVAALWAFGHRRRALAVAAVCLGVALPVGGVTARNWVESGEPVLIASQGGINFYVGNNERSDGKSALAPGFAEAGQVLRPGERYRDSVEIAAITLAERDLGRDLSAGEVNRYWYGRGLTWIRDHPRQAVVHQFRKLVFFWNGHEISNNRDLRDQARRFTPVLGLFLSQWAIVLPFGILGVFAASRSRQCRLLLGFLLVYTLAIAAFFVCSRFRQPAVAWLLPFAAAGLLRTWEHARAFREQPRRAGITAVVLVLLFLATNGRFLTQVGIADVLSENDAPFHRFNLAVIFEREGNLDRAIVEYRAAGASGVNDPRIHLNLGNVLAQTGRSEEARDSYRRVLRMAPDFGPAVQSNLGILAALEKDWPEAIRRFEECVRLQPSHLTGLLGLGAAYLAVGRFDDAIVHYRRALEQPGAPLAIVHLDLATAYLEAGLPEEAEEEALAALRLDPEKVATVVTLFRIYLRQGRPQDAERMRRRALEINPGSPAVRQALQAAERADS